MKTNRTRQICWAAALVLLFASASQATIRYVALDGSGTNGQSWGTAYKSISAAIQASSTVAGDEIRVKTGSYGTTVTIYVDKAVKIYGGYSGVGDTRDWQGLPTTIDGLFTVSHCLDISANATIDGLTITKGKASGSSPNNDGGGLYIHQCSATITNCTFKRNMADYRGGAIALDNAAGTTISDCTFTDNRSSELGGAVFCYHSDATISNCTFDGNKTGVGLNDGYGGAVYTHTCSPTISDCNFTTNSAQYGSGLCNYMAGTLVTACSFTDCNSLTTSGGGVYNWGGSPTISTCLFQDNRVTHRGGAIYDMSVGAIVNCVMWNNTSMTYGGAVYVDPGQQDAPSAPKLVHCTIYGNSSFQGGALYSDNAAPTLFNCILWGNTTWDSEYPTQIFNSQWIYNRAALATCCDIGDDTTYPGTGNIRTDPVFINAAGGGFRLQSSSPCIDAGTNSAPDMPSTDYAGKPRISDGDENGTATADMGAYEMQGYTLSEHVFRGEILEGVVYDNASDTTASYVFMMELRTDDSMDHITFRTPAAYTFTIPNTAHTSSTNVETNHLVVDGVHVWQYWATFSSATGLNSYGDGTYIITYYRTGAASRETRVGYSVAGGSPIPQPTQKPNVTSPAYGASVASPVTLTWDACTDGSANAAFVTVIDVATDQSVAGDRLAKTATASSPYTLGEGTYDAEVSFGSLHDTTDDAAVPFEVGKGVTMKHQFTVLYTTVYRFWSPVNSVHFYTINPAERDSLIANWPAVWTYEGPAYHTAATASDAALRPVYRFWSGHSHFYTINEAEKDMLIRDFPAVWNFEGIAFYAYPEGQQPADGKPVYRFWNSTSASHFYTISETEKDMLIHDWAAVWTFEGVAFYAFE